MSTKPPPRGVIPSRVHFFGPPGPLRWRFWTFFWRRVHVTFTLFEAHFAGKLGLTGGQTPLSHLMGCMAPQDVATSPSSVTLPDLHGPSFLKKKHGIRVFFESVSKRVFTSPRNCLGRLVVFLFLPCIELHTALEGGCAAPHAESRRGHVSTSCSRWLGVQHPLWEWVLQKIPLLMGLCGG